MRIFSILLLFTFTGIILNSQNKKEANMHEKLLQTKNYSHLLKMKGFSENLLNNHFKLYEGYVNNTNKLLQTLHQMLKEDKATTPEFAELKRRLGWELNGVLLHEYYFENLGGDGKIKENSKIKKLIEKNFSSFEEWKKDFVSTGLMRGIGWVVMYWDKENDRIINMWINEHDVGHPSGFKPLLIMDVFEHAFMIDYGLKKADYINAFFENINWDVVEKRME